MKTRDELLQLSISQLVELTLELEGDAEKLRARIAELEDTAGAQPLPTISDEISELPIPDVSHEHQHGRHRHRSWHQRLWRKLFTKNELTRTILVTALVIVVVSVLIGVLVELYYGM